MRPRPPADSVCPLPLLGEESRAIEAGTAVERHAPPLGRRVGDLLARNPRLAALAVLGAIFLVLVASKGLHDVAQTGLNGLSLGAIYALGAVGLTPVYAILRLVNFAHGDFLTFGAYMAYLVNVTWGMPLILGIFFAMAATALLGIFLERVMWGPMRTRGAGVLQLILMSIGLALVIRYVIQYIWSTDIRSLDVNVIDTVNVL